MNNKGFTLIELVATIALLAVIAVISFVSINAVISESKVSNCENLVKSIKSAVKDYVSDNRYGTISTDITAETLISGNYLSSPIVDPFTNIDLDASKIEINISLNPDYTIANSEDSIIIKNNGNKVNCISNTW